MKHLHTPFLFCTHFNKIIASSTLCVGQQFSDVGSVEEVWEPFISQECDVFRMSRSAEKLFTKALHLLDPWEVFSVNIDGTEESFVFDCILKNSRCPI